jgi:hypothetical protein
LALGLGCVGSLTGCWLSVCWLTVCWLTRCSLRFCSLIGSLLGCSLTPCWCALSRSKACASRLGVWGGTGAIDVIQVIQKGGQTVLERTGAGQATCLGCGELPTTTERQWIKVDPTAPWGFWSPEFWCSAASAVFISWGLSNAYLPS